jgi:CubicO group peptidase (beta-lactamase class C family)
MRKQMLTGIVVALSMFVYGQSVADEEEETAAPATIEELESAIADVIVERDVPAIGIAMVDANGPVLLTAIGKADIEADTDVDTESMFRIGSTSKMFVALSVLKLVEEGRLSLDDKVSDLAPEIEFENQWESTDPVRIVHLLEHTTGWDDIHLPEYAHTDPTPATLKEGLDLHPHSRVSRWKPGSRFSYCNAGPPVAAYIVAKITGQSFEDYVQEKFFAPMGMKTMTYRLSADVEAKGVTLYDNGNTPQPYWHISVRPSGSINASSSDMLKMISFFVNRGAVEGEQLVSTASLERMERVGSTPAAAAGQEIGYGLNNYTSVHENWVYRAHSGGVNGGLTELAYLPLQKLGYVFMINSGDGAAYGEISDLIRNFQTRELEPPVVATGFQITDEHRELAGYYSPINSRQEVSYFIERVFGIQKIWIEDDRVMRTALLGGEVSSYLAVSPTLFKSVKTGVAALSHVVDPLAGPVIHSGMSVLKPTSALLVYGQLGVAVLWALSIVLSIVFLLIWGVRRLRGKIAPGPAIRIRIWPLFAALSVIVFSWAAMLGFEDPFMIMGAPTFISVTIMLATIAFAAFTFAGIHAAVIYRNVDMNRGTYWFSTLSSGIQLVVVLYLMFFGVIGIMTWA